jgi:flavin reductase (DIM6/NTAB) family NADH-FMN oxidoreductase RutF/rubredoxin
MDTKAFRTLNYGLYIITAKNDELRAGCVVNTFAQVTSKPAQVSVAINKENVTCGVVQDSGAFEASVLTESATMELIGRFGFRTSTELDKFADTQYAVDELGIPYVTEHAAAHFCAKVVNQIDLGSHILFIGEVVDAEVLSGDAAMTYAYYHKVKGGKTPPKASSYEQPEEATESAEAAVPAAEPAATEGVRYGWKCLACGYVVEMDELPDDYTCPICMVGKEMFKRIEL